MQSRSEQPFLQSRKNHHRRRREDWRRYGNIARRISNEGATENLKSSGKHPYRQHQDRVTYSPLSTVINYLTIPVLRSRPLLAAMGRHTGQRIFRKQRKE